MSKTSWQMGKHLVNGDLENHLKALSFGAMVEYHPTPATSQGSTNLVRKFYVGHSSEMRCSRAEFGKEI